MQFHPKYPRRLLAGAALLLALLLIPLLILAGKKILTNYRFTRYTDQIFVQDIRQNALNLHYTVANPETYGITEYTASLGSFDTAQVTAGYVTAENRRRADERLPILNSLPFQRKGVFASPLLGEIRMERHLAAGQIGEVSAGGENYAGARVCDFAWVEGLYRQCREAGVGFDFWDTGALFSKDGKLYRVPYRLRRVQAAKAGLHLGGPLPPFAPPEEPDGGQLRLSLS